MNKVQLTGNVAREIETRYTQGGMAIASFSIAVNSQRKVNDEWVDEVDFFDITFFGKRAETVAKYFTKGLKVLILGRLKTDSWDDATSGQKRYKTHVIAEDFEFMSSKAENSQQEPQRPYNSQQQPQQPQKPTPPPMGTFEQPQEQPPF